MTNRISLSPPLRRVAAAALLAAAWSVAAAQAPLPQPRTENGVSYLNGGVGDEEIQYVRQSMKDYTMALSFSRSGGEYVASVAVTIKNMKGVTVFEVPSAGPYLLVDLPVGRYSVTANYQGDSQTRPVTAARKAVAANFAWR